MKRFFTASALGQLFAASATDIHIAVVGLSMGALFCAGSALALSLVEANPSAEARVQS